MKKKVNTTHWLKLNSSEYTIEAVAKFLKYRRGRWVLFYYSDGNGPVVGSLDGTEYQDILLEEDKINGVKFKTLQPRTYEEICSQIIYDAKSNFEWSIELRDPQVIIAGNFVANSARERNNPFGDGSSTQVSKFWYWGYDHPQYIPIFNNYLETSSYIFESFKNSR